MNGSKMAIEVRCIRETDYERVYMFQCEYLDQETKEQFLNRVKANPDLYFTAYRGDELLGVCYGHPGRQNIEMNLQGIAVSLDPTKQAARKGIGSALLKAFENAAAARGYSKIGVGSADDVKVELFYIKNGYLPVELVAKGAKHEEFVRLPVSEYESGKVLREELRSKYNAHEVIFIFEKRLIYCSI